MLPLVSRGRNRNRLAPCGRTEMCKVARHIVLLLISVIVHSLVLVPARADPVNVLPVDWNEAQLADFASPVQTENIPRAKIPEYPVTMYLKNGQQSRFELFFLDVRYDYDLVDFETYHAWCLQKSKKIRRNAMHRVQLYNCYDENIPEQFKNTEWNRINYIINHKNGSKSAIQEAIWALADKADRAVSQEAARILEEAAREGKNFRPSEGDLLAIICYPEEKQPVFIEYLIPKSDTFDVAPAFFTPALGVLPAAMPNLLPLVPLLAVPAVPLIPSGPSPPGGPTPPPSVPEPAVPLLMGSALVCFAVWREILRGRKR